MTSRQGHASDKDRLASRALVIIAGVALVAVLVAGFATGRPTKLPDLALGSPLFLYFVRAAVVAYLILGLGGLGYRLWRGDQVKQAQAPGGPGVGLEEAVKPTEELKEGVDEDIRELSERVTEVERKTARPEGNAE